MTTSGPRGTVTAIDGKPNLVLTRTFAAPIAQVWAMCTDSGRLERWIGRWEGDPTAGAVDFFMTAERPDAAPSRSVIHVCEPPRRLIVETSGDTGGWYLWLELDDSGEGEPGTTLMFGQRLAPEDDISTIGPGWEYYLDRLVAAFEKRDVAAIAFEDYFPALQPYYEKLVAAG